MAKSSKHNPPGPQRNIRLAWHHFQFQVPETWEVIGYKKNPEKGQLLLSDRHGQTMQVYWQRMAEEPAVKSRLIDLVEANYEKQLPAKEIRRRVEAQAGWQAFLPRKPDMAVFAGRFLKKENVLLSLSFPPHPVQDNHTSAQHVMRTFKPNNGPEKAWAAFGLDFSLPAEWQPDAISPMPGMQTIYFENRREEEITVYRFGMVPLVLGDDDLATFFARVRGRRVSLNRRGTFTQDGTHPGVILSYQTRGKTGGMMSLLSRTWIGRIWVWRCDDIKRAFAIEQHAREKNLLENLADRVKCQ